MAVFLGMLLVAPLTYAGSEYLQAHPGYLSTVGGERYRVAKEVLIVPPQEDEGPSLHEQIFDEEITEDITRRYEDKFGRTRAQQYTDLSITTRFYADERFPDINRTIEENQEEQRKFGNFFIKRLVEHHVDNYVKTNPKTRPVYELKEKVSNLNVTVKDQYKLRFKYSLSSGDTDIYLKNPYDLENRISIRGSDETAIVLGYPISKTIRLKADYIIENSHSILSAVKRLNGGWTTSITSTNNDEENKVLWGFSWSG